MAGLDKLGRGNQYLSPRSQNIHHSQPKTTQFENAVITSMNVNDRNNHNKFKESFLFSLQTNKKSGEIERGPHNRVTIEATEADQKSKDGLSQTIKKMVPGSLVLENKDGDLEVTPRDASPANQKAWENFGEPSDAIKDTHIERQEGEAC